MRELDNQNPAVHGGSIKRSKLASERRREQRADEDANRARDCEASAAFKNKWGLGATVIGQSVSLNLAELTRLLESLSAAQAAVDVAYKPGGGAAVVPCAQADMQERQYEA